MKDRRLRYLLQAACLAAMLTAPNARAASGTWTATGAGQIEYWTNNANWSASPYPGTLNAEGAGINTATPNTYTCIVDTVIRYFPDYVGLTVQNTGGGGAWLVITNGGKLATYDGWINAGGHVVVSGSGSQLGKFQSLNIAGSGGSLRIENGGSFFGNNSTFGVHIGGHLYGSASGINNCSLIVTGSGSSFTNNQGAQQTQIGTGTDCNSNSVWVLDGARMVTTITLNSSYNSLIISGAASTFEGAVTISGGVSNKVVVQNGGLLDVSGLAVPSGAGNMITNSGGIYQFTTATPTITTNATPNGSIFINGGTISYRNVSSSLDLNENMVSQLTNMIWLGNNALRLHNSTALSAGYTFNTGAGPTNYYRLELVNGTSAVTGSGFTIGANGSMMVSNATANISGAVNCLGTIEARSGRLNCTSGLTLDSGSTTIMGISLTTNGAINVTGTFTSGGTLVVTNTTGFEWADGQTWDLFDWSGAPLSFSSIQLPVFEKGGFAWVTKNLATQGIISVKPNNGCVLIIR